MFRLRHLLSLLLGLLVCCPGAAQRSAPFALDLLGIYSAKYQGAFRSAAYMPDGTAVLLADQGDGLRLLKVNASLSTVIAEAHIGGTGDAGVAMATDSAGNLYVGGNSFSGVLGGTPGALYPSPVDHSLNAFVAGFDKDLHLRFLTFLGADHTVVSGLALTSTDLLVTGTTYSNALPVTSNALQTTPPLDSDGTGFVERLALDGSALHYATYFGGANGGTAPAAIAADASGNAYIVGSTSSLEFSLAAPLQSDLFGSATGFVSKLSADGTHLLFSTLVAGSGLTAVALDPAHASILITGNLSPGRFPVSDVEDPLVNAPYQGLLRLSDDGQQIQDATLLFSGTSSHLSLAPDGTPWVAGSLLAPLTQLQQHAGSGDSYVLHLQSSDLPDAAFRFGGNPTQQVASTSLTSTIGVPSARGDGQTVLIPLALTARGGGSSGAQPTFDLGLLAPSNTFAHGSPSALLPPTCSSTCEVTAGLLAEVSPQSGRTAVTVSADDLPVLLIRNAGPTSATNLQVSASGYTVATNCPTTLAAGQQCGAFLIGSGSGQVDVRADNAPSQSLTIPALPGYGQPLALSASALDFGIVAGPAAISRTFTVTNLGSALQQFTSSASSAPANQPYVLAETNDTCPVAGSGRSLAPGASCEITVRLTGSGDSQQDGLVHAWWQIGSHSLPVTGFVQANRLAVSSSSVQFGHVLASAATRLPRFLYLSNAGPEPVAHQAVEISPDAPFHVDDDCPDLLAPGSVCQIGLRYTRTQGPALDSLNLNLDQGLSVQVTAELVSDLAVPAATQASPLTISRSAIQFADPVTVSSVSSQAEVLCIRNTAASTVPLQLAILGDFQLQNTCPPVLAAGASCDIGVLFAPAADGLRSGALTVTVDGFQAVIVPLNGTGIALLSPEGSVLDLGSTSLGEPTVTWMHVQGTLPSLTVTSAGQGFGVALLPDDGSGHGTLPAIAFKASATGACTGCWIGVQLLSSTAGPASGSLQIASDPNGNPLQLALRGTVAPSTGLLLSPLSADLGNTSVASESAPLNLTVTNALLQPVTANIQRVTTTGPFALLPGSKATRCNAALAPGASCSLAVAFRPEMEGVATGTVQVVTDVGTVSATLTANGAGSSMVAIAPGALTFQMLGQQQLTLRNTTAGTVQVGSPSTNNTAFIAQSPCSSISPGDSCSVWVTYTAQAADTDAVLTVPIVSTDITGQAQTQTLAVPLSAVGTGPSLTLFPEQADFGAQKVGSLGQVRQFTLVNASRQRLLLQLAGSRDFPVAAPGSCATLEPGGTCSFPVAFLPKAGGTLTGSVVISATTEAGTDAGQSIHYLRGYGIAPDSLTLSAGADPANPLSFGQVTSGGSGQQTLTLTNTGATAITVRRLSTTNPFQATSNCSEPLAPGQSCSAQIVYAPVYPLSPGNSQPPRIDTGTLLIDSDGSSATQTVYLSGVALPSSAQAVRIALPALTLSQTAVVFPNTAPGTQSSPQTILLRNTGSVPATFVGLTTSPGFQASSACGTIPPGETCSIAVVFAPGPDSGTSIRSGTLGINTDANSALVSVSLLGSTAMVPLAISPASLTYPPTAVSSTGTAQLTLRNQSQLPVVLGTVAMTGDFGLASTTCPGPGSSLLAGQSCTWTVTFTPSAEGSRLGSLTLNLAGSLQPIRVDLKGTGIQGHFLAQPGFLAFGTVSLLNAKTQSINFANTGTAALHGLSFRLSGPGIDAFTAASTCPPADLEVGAQCEVSITFRPTRTGDVSATLNATGGNGFVPLSVPLTGTGDTSPGFSLTVNGTNQAELTIAAGSSAQFPLVLTSRGGFTGPVHFVCQATAPAPSGDCLLSSSSLNIRAASTDLTATLRTRSGIGSATAGYLGSLALLLLWPLRKNQRARLALCGLALAFVCNLLGGCSTGPGATGAPYTPPGLYTYKVTATSGTSKPLSSSVVLNVRVE